MVVLDVLSHLPEKKKHVTSIKKKNPEGIEKRDKNFPYDTQWHFCYCVLNDAEYGS